MVITCPSSANNAAIFYKEVTMQPEFNGSERRLDELSERLARLHPFQSRPRANFDQDPMLEINHHRPI